MFLVLFCSRWFKVYSTYLAGERREWVGYETEHNIVDIANIPIIDRILHVTSNCWFLIQYLKVCNKAGLGTFPTSWETFLLPFVFNRGLVLLIELRLGCLRIIDMDVEEREKTVEAEKNGPKSEKAPAGKKAKSK